MKKKLVFDCDNTFGVRGCDVDDGLALLYLLGTDRAELLGITATYGNNTVDVVEKNTRRMLRKLSREDIPVYRGAVQAEGTDGQAARFLCEQADRYPGELCILATGSMTNLLAAQRLDPDFFCKISEISLMGGITSPLQMGEKILSELNFSCDPAATLAILTGGSRVSIATGNVCMDAFFSLEQCERRLERDEPFARWLLGSIRYWFARERFAFGHAGIYKWDVYAAALLLEPEWFTPNETEITPTLASLRTGVLLGGGAPVKVRIPRLKDVHAYTEHVYDTYLKNNFILREDERYENEWEA